MSWMVQSTSAWRVVEAHVWLRDHLVAMIAAEAVVMSLAKHDPSAQMPWAKATLLIGDMCGSSQIRIRLRHLAGSPPAKHQPGGYFDATLPLDCEYFVADRASSVRLATPSLMYACAR